MRRRLLTDMAVLVERAEALGLDGAVLRRLRGPEAWDALDVPERIRRGDALWAFALATAPDPLALPVRLARAYEPDDLGALGLAMRSARTVGESLDRLARYHELFLPAAMWRFEPEAEALRIVCVWGPPLQPRHVEASVEFLAVLLPHLLGLLAGRPVLPHEVAFRHTARGAPDALSEALGCAPTFGAGWSGLVYDRAALDVPLVRADAAVSAFVLGELDTLSAQREAGDSGLVLERLRTHVRGRLPDGAPAMTEAARTLALSERTLRRRLAEHGTTWSELVDTTREALARELVRGSAHSLAEVSWLLGFSEPSAFHRAFKRWTGVTPARFRAGEV